MARQQPEHGHHLGVHLLCAAWEKPLDAADKTYFGENYETERDHLVKEGSLRERRGRWYLAPSSPTRPGRSTSARRPGRTTPSST